MNHDNIPLSYAGAAWFVVITNIGCQHRAQMGLAAAGYRTFLAHYTAWVTHARMKKLKRKPLLDRYLFVELDPARQSFETIRKTDGIECLLTNRGMPMTIHRDWVEDLIHRQLKGEFDYASKDGLPAGAVIEVMEGLLESLHGVMLSLSGKKATVKLFGQKSSIQIPVSNLRAVG